LIFSKKNDNHKIHIGGGGMLKSLLNIFKKKCPECKSTKIESLGESVEDGSIQIGFKCHDCEHEWQKIIGKVSADDVV